uniref:Uncharacterized protein n=1 Tax=Oryza sativa subsp. japonica TaxID=39947 RepID=Q6K560_ORYSJ|nr:hypothetical protein [Oryza sativa Japonica Group]
MEQGKAVEIQDQEKKFRRRRKKTTENKVLDRNYATQDRLGFSTSYFSLHGPATGKGAILLQFLQRRAGGVAVLPTVRIPRKGERLPPEISGSVTRGSFLDFGLNSLVTVELHRALSITPCLSVLTLRTTTASTSEVMIGYMSSFKQKSGAIVRVTDPRTSVPQYPLYPVYGYPRRQLVINIRTCFYGQSNYLREAQLKGDISIIH